MKLNVNALGTFYEMAREGAGLAATRLNSMSEFDSRVKVTRLHFTHRSEIRNELDDGGEKVGIRVTMDGELSGTSLLLFDHESALSVAGTLVDDVDDEATNELATSAIVELCHIMNSGFVDGWADVLQAEIDVSAPEYVIGDTATAFIDEDEFTNMHEELALVFQSQIETTGTEFGFEHYLIPEHDSISRLFETQTDDEGIEYEKLAGFDQMAQHGATRVAENLTRMTNIEMGVDIRRINFISLDAIPETVPNEPLVSVAFSFSGTLGGYLLFLFDPKSANELVAATVGESPGGGLGAFEQDAIKELSNVMTSGLLDGWANMLDATIDHSTPAYSHDMGAAVVDPLIVGLSEVQEFAFVFDTRIHAVDREFDVDIYAIPDESDLEAALDRLDARRIDESLEHDVEETEFEAQEFDADVVEEIAAGTFEEVDDL
ncbi:chemotaxis protein CheC [Haloferax sp. MBLA0076]|uniref:Chemotaxis protein CheC n=1 Tax=Haloferax litoreum TaxID=2666140 RepID=A0A6A8GF73_9EURY|nr:MULTISPECIES: chemotaxis protein CheC [Haloferax]KAB1192345.1 chemotaxis protein CheC [Haloferax sp. CBA1148]MRX20807.1 chemotaxis protein CheC [Haloferax litoreum]